MKHVEYDSLLQKVTSPLDYSEDLYLLYVEVAKTTSDIKEIILKHANVTTELEFGYLCEAHMQAIPEIARSLSFENHAIYQIIRLAKITK
ncbi:hypothetical protein [Flavobacterium hibernum]|uniref:Uncharacterized protein n=1 Tax=Flavobacterium hibernum TaxID=37752 RepID=A0ABX4C3L3_9FLAO|nr:hypothetical protein [Flavobacterium hibernum]OXA86762.1 hypothetical protein B0A73_13645 [Flavobacterium hibernum]STO18834.1 Uncharacterised protein [Flavobacterium hibernum]